MHKHADIFKALRAERVTYRQIAEACGTHTPIAHKWDNGQELKGKFTPPTGIPFKHIPNVIKLASDLKIKGVDVDAFWRAEVEHINKMFRDLKESL